MILNLQIHAKSTCTRLIDGSPSFLLNFLSSWKGLARASSKGLSDPQVVLFSPRNKTSEMEDDGLFAVFSLFSYFRCGEGFVLYYIVD